MINPNQPTFREQLIEAAIRKESTRDKSPEALAGRYAIEMLEEICRVMDNQRLSGDELYNSIMKIICFLNVPPHI